MWSLTYWKTVSGKWMRVRWQGLGWWGIHSHESTATPSVQVPALFATCNYSSLIYCSLPWVPLQDFPFNLKNRLYLTAYGFLQLKMHISAEKFVFQLELPQFHLLLCPLPIFPFPLKGRPTLHLFCNTSFRWSTWTHCFLLLFSPHAPSFSFTPSAVSFSLNPLLCLQTCSDLHRLKYISIELVFLHITALPFTNLLEGIVFT